jgi:hypothetical protein
MFCDYWQQPSKRFENDGFESGGIMQNYSSQKVCVVIERDRWNLHHLIIAFLNWLHFTFAFCIPSVLK